MIEAHTYSEVCTVLAKRFKKAYLRKDVNLTGIIFAIPDSPFAKEEILPHIDYWHHRSDNVTDFFCAGFGHGPAAHRDKARVAMIRNAEWWFSASCFNKFVREIEARSSWKHSGGTEIIITTVRYDALVKKASLDFRSAIAIDLDQASKDEAIPSAPHLMQSVFQFAANLNEHSTDPAWDYSDKMGLRIAKSTLKESLLSFLPKALRGGAKKAVHFASRDISPTPA
jgi:hypothetical protein